MIFRRESVDLWWPWKKVLLANSIGMIWEQICAMGIDTLPVLTAWIGILAFTFQIYFDFAGYSDMAIGLEECLVFIS